MQTRFGLRGLAAGFLLTAAASAVADPTSLDSFNVDIAQTSVSGISAGGYMAVQFHVAYSGTVIGAGVVAGGPFLCAKGSVAIALTDCTTPTALDPPDVAYSIRATDAYASQASIDGTGNLARAKVWMFSGSKDTTVYPVVMDALRSYYGNYVNSAQIFYDKSVPAAHSMVTNSYGAACDHVGDENTADNYINNCNYDAAGKLLTYLYGHLNAPVSTGKGYFVEFPQDEFLADPVSHSMNTTGFAYIPSGCAKGARCRVHIAFHGCLQYPGRIGDAFYRHAGYNEWAESNNLIILYPQATASSTPTVYNPKGCFDWWGYDDANYGTRSGRQMKAVKAMLDRLSAGYRPGLPAAPQQVRVSATSDDSVSLNWLASKGPRVMSYHVYYAQGAGQPYALAGNVSSTSTTVSGLASGTAFQFMVRTFSRDETESVDSNAPIGPTTGMASPIPVTPVTLLVP